MPSPNSLQDVILALQGYWTRRGCVLAQPYDIEKGAGTMNPETFLRVLGPEPYRVAYVEPSRRPQDGRYGENPFRVEKHHQFQVILKPSPDDVIDQYVASLVELGIDPRVHDFKLEEDNWESPTLGAMGVGWQVMLDGMEISQFTYFQQSGGIELKPIPVEITYGLERIAMFLTGTDDIFQLLWNEHVTLGDLRHEAEAQFSRYDFEQADVELHKSLFDRFEAEARRLLAQDAVLAAYDHCLKMSHSFNILHARGAIGVTERAGFITRVRRIACEVARGWLARREALGFPLAAKWTA